MAQRIIHSRMIAPGPPGEGLDPGQLVEIEEAIARAIPETVGGPRQYPKLDASGNKKWGKDRVFDARDFGAALDGVTDDWQPLIDMLDAARDVDGGGEVVYDGDMFIDTGNHGPIPIDEHHNIAVHGRQWGQSRIICSGPLLEARDPGGTAWTRGFTLANMAIRRMAGTNTDDCIVADRPVRWDLHHLVIEGFGGDTIRFEGGLHNEIRFNHILARDSTITNGHAAIYLTRAASGAQNTTTHTMANYIGGGIQYGILCDQQTSHGVMIGDIMEYVAVGMRHDTAVMTVIHPYFESVSTADIQLHDSTSLIYGWRGVHGVSRTWSGSVAAADRYGFSFGSRDATAGRDITVGRGLKLGDTPGTGTLDPTAPTDGFVIFARDGVLYARDAAGTKYTINLTAV